MYYMITASPDGIHVYEVTKEQLETELNMPGGFTPENYTYLDELPGSDPNYWGFHGKTPLLIIKGEIVTPKTGKLVIE